MDACLNRGEAFCADGEPISRLSRDEATADVKTTMATAAIPSDFRRFPTIVAVGAIAAAVTGAWGAGIDVSPLFETAEIRRSELWRLLTSAFLHAGPMQLLPNLYWLWELGQPIERVYGHAKTALILVLLAIGPAAFEFALPRGGVGLSGVGYGLVGLLWVLWRRDARFSSAISRSTIPAFAAWFALCVVMTAKHLWPVGNIAHGVGFIFGILLGFALTIPERPRRWVVVGVGALLLAGIWRATLGRPMINLSSTAGWEEAKWGYDALVAHRDEGALRWLRDAAKLQPENATIWSDLAIAYDHLGDKSAADAAHERAQQLSHSGTAASISDLPKSE